MSALTKTRLAARRRGDAARSALPLDQSTIDDAARYRRWRTQKLARVRRALNHPFVEISDPLCLQPPELAALAERVGAMNFALYRIARHADAALSHHKFIALCRQVGLGQLVANPFAHASGISELQVADDARQRAYIPYSNRALNWHTDGYYNPPQLRINGFAMHTVRAAARGGGNRLLDHEVLYLLLRDRDPALAACLFAPDVMTVPPGTDANGAPRPAQSGPVFCFGSDHRRLQMRFTLRARHLRWKSSRAVRAALAEIRAILGDENNPYILTRRLAAGEGIISNNVLHNRAAFVDDDAASRLVLRARFYAGVGGDCVGER